MLKNSMYINDKIANNCRKETINVNIRKESGWYIENINGREGQVQIRNQ